MIVLAAVNDRFHYRHTTRETTLSMIIACTFSLKTIREQHNKLSVFIICFARLPTDFDALRTRILYGLRDPWIAGISPPYVGLGYGRLPKVENVSRGWGEWKMIRQREVALTTLTIVPSVR